MSDPSNTCNDCGFAANLPTGCDPENLCPNLPLAAAYVPSQPFTCLVGPDEALERGSSFENLYMPYKKGGCM
ncbi:MAG: spore coat associated protein CotJA [Firmicutes bacterium]|nr:spore coat associated protein CotJA [Bacillota bacterium]